MRIHEWPHHINIHTYIYYIKDIFSYDYDEDADVNQDRSPDYTFRQRICVVRVCVN